MASCSSVTLAQVWHLTLSLYRRWRVVVQLRRALFFISGRISSKVCFVIVASFWLHLWNRCLFSWKCKRFELFATTQRYVHCSKGPGLSIIPSTYIFWLVICTKEISYKGNFLQRKCPRSIFGSFCFSLHITTRSCLDWTKWPKHALPAFLQKYPQSVSYRRKYKMETRKNSETADLHFYKEVTTRNGII